MANVLARIGGNRRFLLAIVALLAAGWLAGPGALPASSQFGAFGRRRGGDAGEQARVHLPTDRTSTRGVQRAQESIAKGEYSQAIRFLDDMLAREEDIFVELGDEQSVSGLKETARRLIRDLPPEGREAYEAAYGAVAQRTLRTAVQTGDAAALDLVAQRYFYTPAGYEAALLRAMDQADAGQHLAAALTYQQLLETPEAVRMFDPHLSVRAAASWLAAGDAERARGVLNSLLAKGRQSVEIGGREHRLDSTAEPLEWLRETVGQPADVAVPQERQWLTYRGNAARNGAASGGLPHMRVRWEVRLLGHPKLESLYEDFAADLMQAGNLTPVASAPLAVGDYVLTRTPHGLLAVDFQTGKRVWRSEPQRERELEQLVQAGGTMEEEAANPEPARSFARRMWEDYLYGLVSSDGARVYMIRDLPMPAPLDYDMGPFMGGPAMDETAQVNRLCAYELATQGKLVWELDGAAAGKELSGAFFLGAPLSVGQSLYVLMELKGAVYLAALDRTTGELQWRQQLANLETSVLLDLRRRLQAAMPSYEAGILVCPTGAGVVVGVDLAKRSLAWAYRYDATRRPEEFYRGRDADGVGGMASRWADAAATIVEGRVLLTPPESSHLHCLDLRTGKVLWKQDRGEMTRLACVDGPRVLLVGNRKLRAVRLEDGKAAWKKDSLALARGVAPSGSGFLSDGKYYLPLTSAEVIAVDLAEGTIVSRAVARDGAALGNLICHRGAVIAQNGLYLDCFDQIDVLRKRSERRLAKDPADVEALRTLGEVAYNDGRLSEAISMLERAYRAEPDDLEAREVLAECLAAALDEDFTSYRSRLPLLKELQDGGVRRRMLVLRIESEGLLEEGEALASAAACLELYRLAGPADEMIDVGREHHSAVSRWVQAQLLAVWEKTEGDERKELQSQIHKEAEKLGDEPSGEELARFMEFFGGVPTMESLKLARARELGAGQQWLEAQQQLLDLTDSPDAATAGEATARIAAQLHDAGLHSLAKELDRRLSTVYRDVKCLDGATGGQLAENWAKAAGEPMADWPHGRVAVDMAPASGAAGGARTRASMLGVRLERCDSILGRTVGQLSTRGGEFALQDNNGREFFSAILEPESQIRYRQAGTIYGVSRGNLLIVSMGRQLAALNTTAALPDALSSAVLWRVNLGSNLDFNESYFGDSGRGAGTRPGSFRAPRSMSEGKWIGVIGPVTSQGVVWQDQRRLVCVDALTGDERWSRSDVPQGCELFGDERYVFAVPTGSTSAQVFSAVDGRAIGTAKVPRWKDQLVTIGRNVISWKQGAENRWELASRDGLTGEIDWRHEFAGGAAVDVEMGRYVAVVEPAGRAVIIDAATGEALVDEAIPRKSTVEEIHLSCGENDFLVVAKHPRRGDASRSVRAFNMADAAVIDGQVYLFDRASGKMRWSRPADVVQQALLLTQPADLPFIVFAGLLNDTTGRRSGTRMGATMLILDKATGRTLFQKDDLPQAGAGQCIARVTDVDKHEATVEMAGSTILLQFTDQRRPPEPPAMTEAESGAGKSSRGLIGIFFNLGGS